MVQGRRVGFFEGLRYHCGGSMVCFMLHRVTGVGIALLVGIHLVATFFARQGSAWAESLNALYGSWVLQVVVVAFVGFHALNGLRIAIMAAYPSLERYQRKLVWAEWAVFIPLFLLAAFAIINHAMSVGA